MRADSPARLSRDERDPGRLGIVALTMFSLPMVLIQAVEIGWRVYLPAFFTATVGLPLAAIGTLLLAVRIFDSVVDPFIAWASDEFTTRFGRRRPWIAASVPLVMIGALGVFFAAPGTAMPQLAACCVLLHLGFTMLATPHGGWALEIARDANERIRVMGAKQWFAVAGMIGLLLLTAGLERFWGLGRREQTAAIGAAVLVLSPLTAFLLLRTIAEPRGPTAISTKILDPFRLFLSIYKAKHIRTVLLLYVFLGLGDAAAAATFLFFIDTALNLKGWGSTLLLIQPVMAFIALPIWTLLGQRLGKRRVLALVYAWQLAVAPLALVLPSGDLVPAIAYLVARNAFSAVDYMLLRAMLADGAADGLVDRAAPRASGASYYASVNIALRIAMGIGAAVPLWVLANAGYVASEPTVDQSVAWIIRAAYALPSAVAALCCLLILSQKSSSERGVARVAIVASETAR